jgi:predicted ATPase
VHIQKITIASESFPVRDRYPFNLEQFQATREIRFNSPVTFFVGENGTGKSTLLKALSRACDIYIWEGDQRVRLHGNPYEGLLHTRLRVEWTNGRVPGSFFASEIFNHFSQMLDEWAVTDPGALSYFGDQSLMELSHGQGHMAFFRHRYTIRGLYFLDEPENALSPARQLELLRILRQAVGGGQAQFIIATHSPLLMSLPGARILSFDVSPVAEIRYRDTSHYQVYRDFFRDMEAPSGDGSPAG